MKALELARRIRFAEGEAQILANLGEVYRLQGRWDKARQAYQAALEIATQQGSSYGIALMENNWVASPFGEGDFPFRCPELGIPAARKKGFFPRKEFRARPKPGLEIGQEGFSTRNHSERGGVRFLPWQRGELAHSKAPTARVGPTSQGHSGREKAQKGQFQAQGPGERNWFSRFPPRFPWVSGRICRKFPRVSRLHFGRNLPEPAERGLGNSGPGTGFHWGRPEGPGDFLFEPGRGPWVPLPFFRALGWPALTEKLPYLVGVGNPRFPALWPPGNLFGLEKKGHRGELFFFNPQNLGARQGRNATSQFRAFWKFRVFNSLRAPGQLKA